MRFFRHIAIILGTSVIFLPLQAQQKSTSLENTAFSGAAIQWNRSTALPEDIKMEDGNGMGKEGFFTALRSLFDLPEQLQFIAASEISGPGGDQHIRYKLQYKGIELSQTHYLLHLKDNAVVHAHGRLVRMSDRDVTPSLSAAEAYGFACADLGISEYEAKQGLKLVSQLSEGHAPPGDHGKLVLSGGLTEEPVRQYRLAYRFDIATADPLQRFDIEIDATTGEVIATYPTLFHENIPTRGISLYNDTVDIVVSDSLSLGEWDNLKSFWHTDSWNAYQDSGVSWWMADTQNFAPGGYENSWHEALVTDPIILAGPDPRLEFVHRYNLEMPEGAADYDERYDGWDGINVRISRDNGTSWEVLSNPEPAYTCNSLWSFGGIHNEGPGTEGWAGRELAWTRVYFDLAPFADDTVQIRFEFASDGGYSTLDDKELFGWQIDEIRVCNDSDTLFANSGESTNIHPQNLFVWAGETEGRYRLRETTRGKGIATLDASSGDGFSEFVDYAQDSLPLLNRENMVGVGIHWATERTYDFFLERFNRNSFDDQGGTIISYADWMLGEERLNAFWSGNYAAYGAGNGNSIGSFGAIDVVGHEITHGVTQYSANLIYRGEPGALNESFSDIFGTAVEFYGEGREKGDWRIGENVVKGSGAIRSMENPKLFECPDTYFGEYWIDTRRKEDFGGVHTNSGVQNYWFYLLSEGGTGVNDDNQTYQVNGIGLDEATSIAYRNLTHYLMPDSKYHEAVIYSIQSAEDLFGKDSPQVQSTMDAWDAVGVYLDPKITGSDSELFFEAPLGDSESRTITLQNKGMEPLTITGMDFADTVGFSLGSVPSLPLTLERLERRILRVLFSPAFEGLHENSLLISSNDSIDPEFTIHLSGEGLAPTGIQREISQDLNAWSVYPNPTGRLITVETETPGKYQVRISSLNGREIVCQVMEGTTHQFDLVSLQRGVYFITIMSNDFVTTRKIIKW